ncbi:hypothetical protein AVEN_194072-1 [Araneus ventricosus]|uniref:Uncharacterized protein n=1 Tax=Araneus ventricosus TaxID=182803 RepID=A0A4Y2JUV5_ARAVE|nr:hypothetical protein AVEN_194072-1 [Araneus ventricosus]
MKILIENWVANAKRLRSTGLVTITYLFEETRGLVSHGLVILNRGLMTRTTPELATPLKTSAPYQREDVWSRTCDLTCNRPHTRRIISRNGFHTLNLPVTKQETQH